MAHEIFVAMKLTVDNFEVAEAHVVQRGNEFEVQRYWDATMQKSTGLTFQEAIDEAKSFLDSF